MGCVYPFVDLCVVIRLVHELLCDLVFGCAFAFVFEPSVSVHLVLITFKLSELVPFIYHRLHTFQWICSIVNRPPDLTKPHCDLANQRRPVCGTQPSSRMLDNPHLGLSGQTILVQHLTNYRLTGQSILYQLQTGWLVSIMILIVPIAD